MSKASLTCAEYDSNTVYTPRPGNGGGSGTGYSKSLSPCNSEGHSSLAFGQGSHRSLALCAAVSAVTRPLHSFSVAYSVVKLDRLYHFFGVLVKRLHEKMIQGEPCTRPVS